MRENQRAAIAGIVLNLTTGKKLDSVYSVDNSKFINLFGSVDKKNVDVHDFTKRCHLVGNASAEMKFSLFDKGAAKPIDLHIEGRSFSGYDHKSAKNFKGTIGNGSISLYDFETGKYHNFTAK